MALLYIKWFKELSREDVPLVGGKGANLGEMWNNEFPVPSGFSVTADAYRTHLKKNNITEEIEKKLKDLDIEDTDKLQATAKEIQELIASKPMPDMIKEEVMQAYSQLDTSTDLIGVKSAEELIRTGRDLPFVAVRSSATAEDLPEASFAGQQATFLNIKGNESVLEAVKNCWASLFTARAIYYREKNKFPHMKVALSAIVQKMVNSEKAGVMFSINPATNNKNEIIIEAAWGLGEAVVSGAVSPDEYIINKDTGEITQKRIKKQTWGFFRGPEGKSVKKDIPKDKQEIQVLSERELTVLARLAKKVEEHYQFPQDMEWAIEGSKIYLVQARPVTTLKEHIEEPVTKPKEEEKPAEAPAEPPLEKKEVLLTGLGASPGTASGPVRIIKDIHELDKVQKGDVLVAPMTNPDMVPAMQRAAAIVTDEGGVTCHAAIVSREMGVPCIVGTGKATQVLKDGQMITVDGPSGNVYKGEVEEPAPAKEAAPVTTTAAPIATATQVKVIMDLPQFAEKAAATGAHGVGLLRLEGIIATNRKHPGFLISQNKTQEYVGIIYNGVKTIASAFKNYPVWVRTSDLRTDEYRGLEGGDQEPEEPNPMLGWHGIRRALAQQDILKAEFQAIKKIHDEGLKNVGVMLPFLSSVSELQKAKEIAKSVGLEPQKDIQFGVMIETPASVWIIEELCKEGMDFVSFGTNDLTQTTLGVDRNNEKIQYLYDWNHPAVWREIEHVIKVCKKHNVETSICGQAGSEPKMVKFLVNLGIDSISANIDAVQTVKEVVYQTEKKLLLDAAREELEEE